MLKRNLLPLLVLLVSALPFTGCMDITGRGPAPLQKTVDPEVVNTHPRVGHIYCMRGWLGIFSTGMDALADKIDKEVGAPAVSVADEEWIRLQAFLVEEHKKGAIQEPLVLLGHSYGADDSIRVCRDLKEKDITVDLLVLLNPVTPPLVPDNVKRVYCVYKSHPLTDWYPAWRGVPASVENKSTPIVNINLRTTDVGWDTTIVDHINIEKVQGVHNMVMEEIKKTCPLRTAWHPASKTSTPVTQANTITPAAKPVVATP